MQNKKGISLIVLVITIIVMIILAASVVISLSNTGIIDRAGKAVDLTNEASVQDLAALVWADAYMDPDKKADIENVVKQALAAQGVTEEEWDITVRDTGVTVNKKQNSTKELTSLQPGEFVNYTAGKWTEAEIASLGILYSGEETPNESNPYTFGGFKVGQSKDLSINIYESHINKYEGGWRVLSVENGIVKIVHAGTPEGYYTPREDNNAYKSEYILNKDTTNENITETIKSEVTATRSWTMYENNLAISGSSHTMTEQELSVLNVESDLRKIGSNYWVPSAATHVALWYMTTSTYLSNSRDVCYGIRPVVTLKPEVLVVGGQGTYESPYQLVIQ